MALTGKAAILAAAVALAAPYGYRSAVRGFGGGIAARFTPEK